MKDWNPNPDERMVKGIYNGLYARWRLDNGPQAKKERVNSKRSRAHRLDVALKEEKPTVTRARTHDHAAKLPDPDAAHVGWLAISLLEELKRAGPRANVPTSVRFGLIHLLAQQT